MPWPPTPTMAIAFVSDILFALLLNRAKGADLLADGAAVAVFSGDGNAVLAYRQSRAGSLIDADFAILALIGVDTAVLALALTDHALEQGAGLADDDHKHRLPSQRQP